ncbi:MAG: BACON domain-containing protein [Bacteroidales bacterium]|nr:BACON domain-containing protein [Bacteroidales bacterium]
MKLRNLMMTVLGLAAVVTACEEEDGVQGLPEITISEKAITVEEVSSSASVKTISLVASRDWSASSESEWIEVEPASGKASPEPQEVTITLLPNTGLGRTGYVKFDIIYDSKTLTVNQNGPLGSAEDAIIYYNDFDKEPATQSFGTSGTSWPYLDQFEGWKNQTGSGADNVEYSFSGISCRNNSNSDGNYSDYAGSGVNNLLFSSNPNFVVKNIALAGKRNLTLSFGTEKYAYGEDDNTFKPEEFNVYVSNDNEKWVKREYAFPGDFKNGRWDIALSTFTVPEGTENLSIYFASTLSGGHRMDDVKLVISENEGTAIDFSTGTDIPVGGGTGGDTPGSGDNSGAIYYNNFDKAEATKTFGTNGSSYPYLDQFDGWKNEIGSGAASVSYLFNGMSARNNSVSNGDYAMDSYKSIASGLNNLFFGTSAYFAVKDIDLGGKTNLTISFGTEKYDESHKDAAFDPTEFSLYVSADATKWVKVDYTFPNALQAGKWDLASATITVPSGTAKLAVYVAASLASVYRLDDLKVAEAAAAGTAIDFSKGVDLNIEGGNSDGGNTNPGDGGNTGSYQFKKATSITSGKSYIMVAAGMAAKPIAADKTYGYLSGDAVTVSGDVITMTSLDNAFVFTSTTDGYTIKGSDNRYLYQTGTYNSFNVTDTPTEGQYWEATVQSDGTVKILNKSVNKYIQWSAQYKSYGSYADATGEMPVLYELQDGTPSNPGDGGNTNPGDGGNTGKYDFKKASSVVSGKSYIMVAAGMAAKPIAADKTYGYLNGDALTASGDVISLESLDNAFVFTSTNDGYTIKGSDNRYLYQTGTYNSFNVNASPTEGQYWSVEIQSDGTAKILNKSVNKYIQWSAQYKSYGSYADATGEMPVLYELQGETPSNPGDGGNTNPGDGGNTNPGDGGNTNPGDGGNDSGFVDNTPSTAKDYTVDFSTLGYENAAELTTVALGDTGVTLTFDKGTGSTTPKYYTSGTAARLYGGNTLTVAGKKVYKIVFTCPTSNTINVASTTFSAGAYDEASTTWAGETESLVITNTASSGHIRFQKMTVYYAE